MGGDMFKHIVFFTSMLFLENNLQSAVSNEHVNTEIVTGIYREQIETDTLLDDIDEDVPVPVFNKPSTVTIWVRSGGIYILCKILAAKQWLAHKYAQLTREIKIVTHTT
jgi:hypothetical protein